MQTTQPYTYLIGWSTQQRFYYGVRFAKGCNPSDLWQTYFTSSKHVSSFRLAYGEPDIIEIRRVFATSLDARSWEHRVLKRLKVVFNELWLNKTDNKSISSESASFGRKGKTYEEIYGVEVAMRLKNLRSIHSSGRTRTPEQKEKQSKSMKGKISWNKGIPRTEEEKMKMRGPRNKRSTEAIEAARKTQIGKKWYFNQETLESKKFSNGCVPLGWLPGRKPK